MSEKKEAQSGVTGSGQMERESLSEQIIQNFLSGGSNPQLTALVDAAGDLLVACKAVVKMHYTSNREMERIGLPRNKMPLAHIICLDAIAKAEHVSSIPDASESATASSKPKEN